ncbi:hypothetical protein SAY86_022727 [Trapa natans]|uniref:RING-type E3 ubiquitin transferase n=1 Tax=Trapa natans TaxID=22666 RepID=A0AAN7M5P7_TRANT|nr:hypothetical protein SAY86_022727 [Trapa natans]
MSSPMDAPWSSSVEDSCKWPLLHLLCPSSVVSSICQDEVQGISQRPEDEMVRGNRMDSKIMMVSIIWFMVIISLMTLLYVTTSWLLHRQARRRATLHGLDTVNRSNEQPPKRGLDPSVISSLPTIIFRQSDVTAECAVCLSLLEEDEVVKLLLNCKHNFHVECIDMWLALHSTCPVCRAEAWPAAQPEHTSKPAESLIRSLPPEHLCIEGTSSYVMGMSSSHERNKSFIRLSSFQRMLSRERSTRRIQPQQEEIEDIERQ